MAAAYGGERLPAWVFLPKNALPPYQTVVFYPSGEGQLLHDSGWLGPQRHLLFVIRSGRAVLYPIYQGTYERNHGPPSGPNEITLCALPFPYVGVPMMTARSWSCSAPATISEAVASS